MVNEVMNFLKELDPEVGVAVEKEANRQRRNLELIETMREKRKIGSLFWVLDNTKTAMGARLLRSYIEQPLIDKQRIIKRQNAIDEFLLRYIDREELREYLSTIYDLERLMGRISQESANPRDLLSFGNSKGLGFNQVFIGF